MSAFKSTIVITGGTTGLGYWTAYELACRFPDTKILICSRTDKDHAADSLNKLTNQKHGSKSSISQIEFLPLDLESIAKVREFVSSYSTKGYPPISALLLNAGLQFHLDKDIRLSPDGVESTFAVNHLGHALLFFLLKPYLSPDARIVLTASGTHDPAQKTRLPDAVFDTAELLAHPTDKDGYRTKMKGGQRYASSKLANVLFTYALEKRLKAAREAGHSQWTCSSFDPGLMPGTSLGRDAGRVAMWIVHHILTRMIWLLKLLTQSSNVHLPQESGRSLANLTARKGADALSASGKYFSGDHEIPSSVESHKEAKQEDLWRWTVDFLAQDEAEKKAFETF